MRCVASHVCLQLASSTVWAYIILQLVLPYSIHTSMTLFLSNTEVYCRLQYVVYTVHKHLKCLFVDAMWSCAASKFLTTGHVIMYCSNIYMFFIRNLSAWIVRKPLEMINNNKHSQLFKIKVAFPRKHSGFIVLFLFRSAMMNCLVYIFDFDYHFIDLFFYNLLPFFENS